ncbi:MAG: sensor histidine kinase, partial [Cellulosimicrobium funkei]
MRRRMLQATVAAVAVAVILLGFPLAFYGARFVLQGEVDDLSSRVERLSRSIDARLATGDEIPDHVIEDAVQPRASDPPAHVYVALPDGTVLTAGDEVTGREIEQPLHSDSGALVTLTVSYWDAYLRAAQVVLLVVAAAIVA